MPILILNVGKKLRVHPGAFFEDLQRRNQNPPGIVSHHATILWRLRFQYLDIFSKTEWRGRSTFGVKLKGLF